MHVVHCHARKIWRAFFPARHSILPSCWTNWESAMAKFGKWSNGWWPVTVCRFCMVPCSSCTKTEQCDSVGWQKDQSWSQLFLRSSLVWYLSAEMGTPTLGVTESLAHSFGATSPSPFEKRTGSLWLQQLSVLAAAFCTCDDSMHWRVLQFRDLTEQKVDGHKRRTMKIEQVHWNAAVDAEAAQSSDSSNLHDPYLSSGWRRPQGRLLWRRVSMTMSCFFLFSLTFGMCKTARPIMGPSCPCNGLLASTNLISDLHIAKRVVA